MDYKRVRSWPYAKLPSVKVHEEPRYTSLLRRPILTASDSLDDARRTLRGSGTKTTDSCVR